MRQAVKKRIQFFVVALCIYGWGFYSSLNN